MKAFQSIYLEYHWEKHNLRNKEGHKVLLLYQRPWQQHTIMTIQNNLLELARERAVWVLKFCLSISFWPSLPPLGTCLFWEFATEYYDLGFGVSFEWSQPQTKNITVAVNESDEDEFAEDDKATENESSPPKPRIDEVLPVVRRPCNEEVIVGSHMYPGRGVYLLKFDNSYSLFRSKTLYYRVYYTRW